MRYLPFAMTRGRMLAEVIREAAQDPRRRVLCGDCGARMQIAPGRTEQSVRCPGCARWQHVSTEEEAPWHLTPSSAEALRRTRTWLRRL